MSPATSHYPLLAGVPLFKLPGQLLGLARNPAHGRLTLNVQAHPPLLSILLCELHKNIDGAEIGSHTRENWGLLKAYHLETGNFEMLRIPRLLNQSFGLDPEQATVLLDGLKPGQGVWKYTIFGHGTVKQAAHQPRDRTRPSVESRARRIGR